MNIIRIRKRLSAPVPGLPELTPLVGKTVRIVAVEESADQDINDDGFWDSPTADELAAEQGVGPIRSIDDLARTDFENAFDGFDEALRHWRNEPWRDEDR